MNEPAIMLMGHRGDYEVLAGAPLFVRRPRPIKVQPPRDGRRAPAGERRFCNQCGAQFAPTKLVQRFCGRRCQGAASRRARAE